MNALTNDGFLPKEHFSKNISTTDDAKFDKTLTEDLSRQIRHPMVTVSVDASQCYDKNKARDNIPSVICPDREAGPHYSIINLFANYEILPEYSFGDSVTFLDGEQLSFLDGEQL